MTRLLSGTLAVAAAVSISMVAAPAALAAPLASSTFDTDAEGWLVVSTEGYVGAPDWADIGGDHGGVIYDTDMDNGGWGFLAGPEFQGAFPAAYGDLLMFDVNSNRIEHPNISIALADSAGIGIIAYVPTPAAINIWAHRELQLDTSQGWYTFDYFNNIIGGAASAGNIQDVLDDLKYLFLGAEFADGYDNDGTYTYGELVAYDNVFLMPEPGTAALIALGLAALAARRRRR